MMDSLSDPSVKLQSLRGLGNIASAGPEKVSLTDRLWEFDSWRLLQVNKHAQTVMDALTSNLENPDPYLCMEAMAGLSKVALFML